MSTSLPPPGSKDVVYVIDVHCWVYRFFATTGSNSARLFLEFVGKILRSQRPRYFAAAADAKQVTFRHEMLPRREETGEGYKANREPPNATLLEQLRWSRDYLEDVFATPIFYGRGFEADDHIAWLVHEAKHVGLRTVIVGLDKDLLQLVDGETVFMWDGKSTVWGAEEVKKKFGLLPAQLPCYQAIVGDKADNVPGARGLGPKAALEILHEFGSVEEAMSVAHTRCKKKDGAKYEKLLESREEVNISKRLVTLAHEIPDQVFDIKRMRRPVIGEETNA